LPVGRVVWFLQQRSLPTLETVNVDKTQVLLIHAVGHLSGAGHPANLGHVLGQEPNFPIKGKMAQGPIPEYAGQHGDKLLIIHTKAS
jgi:hypothetical protein